MKKKLFSLRLSIAKNDKSKDWELSDVLKICSKLKNGKTRDKNGLIYELFKPQYCGLDVHLSILEMFNGIKRSLMIPDFYKQMSITSIYKNNNKPKNRISNERGIFNLSKLRCILEKMLHEDVYPKIEQSLTCSNVGGRKGKGMRDQIFIINSIINEVIHGKGQPICITSYDIIQAFDKMSFSETNNDLWDVHVNNDKFYLISELDKECHVTVKSSAGETKPFLISERILQG